MASIEQLEARIQALEGLVRQALEMSSRHHPRHAREGQDGLVGYAPSDVDYLGGTATGELSNEIAVGTVPGGELGGTWPSPTVDATHSGSAHHAQAHGTSQHTENGNWKINYSNGSGDDVELALGADGTFLQANGVSAAPTFAALVAGDIPGATHPIWISAVALEPTVTNGAARGDPSEQSVQEDRPRHLAFDKTTQEVAYIYILMGDNWNASTVTVRFVWAHATACASSSVDDVVWGCRGLSIPDSASFQTNDGTAQEVTDTSSTVTNKLPFISAATSPITLADGPVAGELIRLTVYRDPE